MEGYYQRSYTVAGLPSSRGVSCHALLRRAVAQVCLYRPDPVQTWTGIILHDTHDRTGYTSIAYTHQTVRSLGSGGVSMRLADCCRPVPAPVTGCAGIETCAGGHSCPGSHDGGGDSRSEVVTQQLFLIVNENVYKCQQVFVKLPQIRRNWPATKALIAPTCGQLPTQRRLQAIRQAHPAS